MPSMGSEIAKQAAKERELDRRARGGFSPNLDGRNECLVPGPLRVHACVVDVKAAIHNATPMEIGRMVGAHRNSVRPATSR